MDEQGTGHQNILCLLYVKDLKLSIVKIKIKRLKTIYFTTYMWTLSIIQTWLSIQSHNLTSQYCLKLRP